MATFTAQDPLDPTIVAKGKEYDQNRTAQQQFQKEIREFIETKPLYSTFSIQLPPRRDHFFLEVAQLDCRVCKSKQAFRAPERLKWYYWTDRYRSESENKTLRAFDKLMSGVFPIELECQGCKQTTYDFFVHVDVHNSKVRKFGQMPMWWPKVDPVIVKEFGVDAVFYRKALANLGEGYGIGACAYLRRLIEKYINPLLELLYELKQQEGASQEALDRIQDVIRGKDFSAKTKFASEIAPAAITAPGMNPLKTLHDLLSRALHNMEEEEAVTVAQGLITTLEYVIPRLRKQFIDQKKYLEAMKTINNP